MANGRVTYDDLGNMYIEGIGVNVKENSYKVSETFKKLIKDIELQFKTAAISEAEYYKQMENLRDAYLEKGTKEWWSYTNKIISYEDDLVAREQKALEKQLKEEQEALEKEKTQIEEIYSEIASAIYDTQDEILKAQESFKKKFADFSEVSTTIKQVFVGLGENGGDLVNYKTTLNDLEAQKEALKEYKELLFAVYDRGKEHFGEEGFSDFFSLLRSLSPTDGKALLKELLKEKDESFFEFVGDWNDIQKFISDFAKEAYQTDTKLAMGESLEYMKTVLQSFGLEVPEDFFASGVLSAEKFGEGFVSEMESVMNGIGEKFNELMPEITSNMEPISVDNVKNIFAPTYNINGGEGTFSEKLQEAQAQATADRLRGGW